VRGVAVQNVVVRSIVGEINFYSRKEGNYGWLSNFWQAAQVVDGAEYPTNEHFYQSQKANNPALAEWIRSAPTPFAAMKAGRSLRPTELVQDWNSIRVDVMAIGLRAKFTQNPDLKFKLLATGYATLHEDSPSDMYWGKRGEDMLGRLLMQIREELRQRQ
jgi:ribA/ribD-fused uncharacterized protein